MGGERSERSRPPQDAGRPVRVVWRHRQGLGRTLNAGPPHRLPLPTFQAELCCGGAKLDQPSIPDGYISFPDIMGSLFWNLQDWKLQSKLLLFQIHKYKLDKNDPVEAFQMERKWKADAAARSFIQATLGKALASERTQAVGIKMYNGELTFLKGAAWRVLASHGPAGRRALPAISAAFEGSSISVVEPGVARRGQYFPMLGLRALAELFEALNLPEPPKIVPEADELDINPAPKNGFAALAVAPLDALHSKPNSGNAERQADAPQVGRSRGGRPPTHEWDTFWVEVALWTAENDVDEPAKQRPELRRHMLQWVASWEPAPDASTVDKKLSMLWERAARAIRAT